MVSWQHAMPLAGLAGGLMIGVSAALMLLGDGRIAGVSGLAARAAGLANSTAPLGVAWAFIVGLPLGALLVRLVGGQVVTQFSPSWGILVAGGLAVGIGTRVGSGCTSGHGVCGMSRFSMRSIVATVVFIGAGMVTVAAMRWLGVRWG